MAEAKGIQTSLAAGNKGERDGINYLLVIAIDDYQHFSSLGNCVQDAERLIDVLTNKYRFEKRYVTKLYNKAAAKQEDIWKAMNRYRKVVKPQDSLIIYFSGHGGIDGFRGFWIPADARKGVSTDYFSSDDIKHELNWIPAFHIILISDACFAGSIFDHGRARGDEFPTDGSSNNLEQSRYGLTASTSKEVAYDSLRTGEGSSPFTGVLIRNLKDYKSDIGFLKVATDVRNDVRRFTGGKQNPVFQLLDVQGHHQGEFVFRLKGQNTFTDPRDFKVYRTVEMNGLTWMAQNLDYQAGEGWWHYADNKSIGKIFGRLYTLETAKKACPPGWRLPTDEEVKALIDLFGGEKKAYAALIEGGSAGFDALLGGSCDCNGVFDGLGYFGEYWSIKEYDADYARAYIFSTGGSRLTCGDKWDKSSGLYCRCVKEAH